jgi:hypothetical protein
MNIPFLSAWLEKRSRRNERRRLYRELANIGVERVKHPERHTEYFAAVCNKMARLQVLHVADIEARMKPAPLWPGLPQQGNRIRPMSFQHAPEAVDFLPVRAKVRLMDEDDCGVGNWRAPV